MASFSYVDIGNLVRETNLAIVVDLLVESFSPRFWVVCVLNPLYSDGFSHTDSYNKDGIFRYIL